MKQAQKPWALITGASSGFGIDYAHLLAARGYHIALAARSTAPMQQLATQLQSQYGVRTAVVGIDLAAPGAAQQLKAQLDQQQIAVDVLINNAGYGLFGDFLSRPLHETRDMLQLNILTLTELTHVFAGAMRDRGIAGHILLVASIGAYQATPSYAAYSASKAYVLLLGEALHEELKPHGITISTVSPGITATRFLAVSGQKPTLYQRLVMMQSRPVAKAALAALFHGQASMIPGWLNKITIFSNRFMPRIWQSKVAYQLMKN